MAATDDRRREACFEQFLGNFLRAGVLLAAAVVLAGAVVYLAGHGGERAGGRVFRGEPADLRDPAGVAGDAARLSSRGVIQLGLLVLVATPVLRVALSAVGFLRARDWVYVALTIVVLAVLLYGLFRG